MAMRTSYRVTLIIKINLNNFSLEELEYLDSMHMNNLIKIDNEENSQKFKEFYINKIQKMNSIKDIEGNFNLEKDKQQSNELNNNNNIFIEINDLKGIINEFIFAKREREIEINSLKEILNFKLNVERRNKDLEEEVNELRKENELQKANLMQMSKINEIILKTYQNKLMEFSEFSANLSTFVSESNNENDIKK